MPNHPLQFQNWYLSHSEHFQEQTSIEYVGTPEFGINHLIYHQLSGMEAPIWFEITPRVAHDPVLTANTLVDAFNKAAGERLLDHGMQYPYVLNIIKKYTPLFGAHTFVFSGTHLAPEFARAMLELKQEGHTLILIGEERLSDLPILTNEDLRVTRSEAFQLAESLLLSEPQIQDAYDQTRGVFEPLWIRLNELARRPIPLRPTADGFKHPPGYEVDLDPKLLVSLLRKKEKHMEALEIAVPNCPHLVPQFIEEAGSRALLTGAHAHLHVLLEALPREVKEDEVVMRWRIEAAYLMDKKAEIKEEVLEYLEKHEAPDVRALAVLYMIFDRNLSGEIQKISHIENSIYILKAKTFLSCYQKDSVFLQNEDPYKALAIAEENKNILEIIRCIQALSKYCINTLRFKEYLYWSKYGYEIIGTLPNINTTDRLSVINSFSFSLLIHGRLDDLNNIMMEGERIIDNANEAVSLYFRSTIAEYDFFVGNYIKSLDFWKKLWNSSDRNYKAYYSGNVMKSLIALSSNQDMEEFLDEIKIGLVGLHENFKIHSMIAELMYYYYKNDSATFEFIKKVDLLLEKTYHPQVFFANTLIKYIYQIKYGKILLSNQEISLVKNIDPIIIKSYFGEIFYKNFFIENKKKIKMKFVGRPSILINDKIEKIPLRQLEILLVLSMHKEGLSGEKLLDKIYGECEENYGSLKTSVSKLRKFIDIGSSPYKILDNYECDVVELLNYIEKGDIDNAFKIYNDKILLESESEYINEITAHIKSSLNNMAIRSRSLDFLIKVYEIDEDFDVLDNILSMVDENHPKFIVLKSKYNRALKSLLDG